mgnify:CR=1 FL=1
MFGWLLGGVRLLVGCWLVVGWLLAAVDGEPSCPITAVERPYFVRSVGNSHILLDGLSVCGTEEIHIAAAENAEAKEAEAKEKAAKKVKKKLSMEKLFPKSKCKPKQKENKAEPKCPNHVSMDPKLAGNEPATSCKKIT